MNRTKLAAALETLTPFLPDPTGDGRLGDARVLSLLYPRPDAEGDAEKFDLAKKNLLAALDDEARGPEKHRASIRKVAESLHQDEFPEGGIAVFSNGDETVFRPLNHRPAPALSFGPAALALPALADASEARSFWIAVLDAEDPRLLHVEGSTIHDETPREVMTLTEQMKQYEPMASVIWHSSSSVRRGGARQQFHALGTATEDLRKDEITRVLLAFGKQVDDKVQGDDPLILAGGPSRLGHFMEHFEHRNLAEEHVQAAGDALDEDELFDRAFAVYDEARAKRQASEVSDYDTTNALRGINELRQAAQRGRLDTVLIHPDHLGLLPGDDERLKLPETVDEKFAARSEIVSYAVKHGADLVVTERDTESGLLGLTRYD